MTGLVKRTGKPVWLVRTAIEVVVLGAGWAFGGIIGIGTVMYALGIGPIAHVLMPWFALANGRGVECRNSRGKLLAHAVPFRCR